MKCPKCGAEMRTGKTLEGSAIQIRRRECSNAACGESFVTEEHPGDPRVYRRLAADLQRQMRGAKNVVTGDYKMRLTA